MRILFLLVCMVYMVHSVVPMMSMTRRVQYVRTQFLVPCEICKHAVADKIEYGHHPRQACMVATKNHFQQDVCVSLLRTTLKGHSPHEICINTKMTDCTTTSILCDIRVKNGVCHVV